LGATGRGAGVVGRAAAIAARPAPRDRGVLVDTYEAPVPGMPTDCVTRPLECTLTCAPRVPRDALTPRGVTVMRTPGTTVNDLRSLKPTATSQCGTETSHPATGTAKDAARRGAPRVRRSD
jgi:hypothetical protein